MTSWFQKGGFARQTRDVAPSDKPLACPQCFTPSGKFGIRFLMPIGHINVRSIEPIPPRLAMAAAIFEGGKAYGAPMISCEAL